jgi:hypothetical protein
MATTLTNRLAALQLDVEQQRKLIQRQIQQIEKQQVVLDVQFRRIANIQAELDLVKATIRLAVPEHAAKLMGLSPTTASALFPTAT